VNYRWHYGDGAGAAVPGPELSFPDQAEAEEWLSANWPDLLDGGIEEVSLLNGDEPVYGPMSLRPAQES
jgi:hypothetical protein